MNTSTQSVFLANPRGFCAGVERAISIVEMALEKYGAPVYVRHEVIHNQFVVNGLRERGAVFVEDLKDVPMNSRVIFSAHGVSRKVREEAKARGLSVLDATCPLVTKVHVEVERYIDQGLEVIMIGHAGHPEVEGTMGQSEGNVLLVESIQDIETLKVRDPSRLAYVSQTTLSVDDTADIIDALRRRFPGIHGPRKDDICYATQNRQDAVKKMVEDCDLVLVVGSKNSSNSNRLKEIAELRGVSAYLIDGLEEISDQWLEGVQNVGITAGASAPENLVQEVVEKLRGSGFGVQEVNGPKENVSFSIPVELR